MSVLDSFEKCVLSEQDKDEILNLTDVAFRPREPLAIGIHASNEDLRPFYVQAVESCFASKASIGLREKSTGKLVGYMLNLIITSPDAEIFNFNLFTEKSKLYARVMYDFCSGINVIKNDGMKKQIELLLLTVHPDFSKKGLGTELVRLSEEKGRELGCDVATIQATNPYTALIANKLGWTTVRKTDVSTFIGEDGQQLLDLSAMNDITHFTYLTKRL